MLNTTNWYDFKSWYSYIGTNYQQLCFIWNILLWKTRSSKGMHSWYEYNKQIYRNK